jgi:hypothetical protein
MIKITGVKSTMQQLKESVSKHEAFIFKTELHKVLRDLQEATPVDTGKARDGWHIHRSSIENDVPYVQQLNEGSSKQAPAHFIEGVIISNPNLIVKGTIVRDK